MRYRAEALGLAAALVVSWAATGSAQAIRADGRAPGVQGDWLVPGGVEVVRLAPCGAHPALICGSVAWLKHPNDRQGRPRVDSANPDPALRNRPLVGLTILIDLKADASGLYKGKVYAAGKTYDAQIVPRPDGRLRFGGCIMLACHWEIWTRAQGLPPPDA